MRKAPRTGLFKPVHRLQRQGKPTNSEFIAMIADRLQLQQKEK